MPLFIRGVHLAGLSTRVVVFWHCLRGNCSRNIPICCSVKKQCKVLAGALWSSHLLSYPFSNSFALVVMTMLGSLVMLIAHLVTVRAFWGLSSPWLASASMRSVYLGSLSGHRLILFVWLSVLCNLLRWIGRPSIPWILGFHAVGRGARYSSSQKVIQRYHVGVLLAATFPAHRALLGCTFRFAGIWLLSMEEACTMILGADGTLRLDLCCNGW